MLGWISRPGTASCPRRTRSATWWRASGCGCRGGSTRCGSCPTRAPTWCGARAEGVTVAGPDTTAKLVGVAAGDVLVGMRFLPGAGGVLGVPLDELRDQRVDVGEVDGAFALDGELEPAEVIARFAWAAAGREADPLVAAAARMVSGRPIGDVARELGISERQLRRRFHASVGYGPKTLARILRFRRFVEEIDGGRTDLAALAFDAGYADQAHLDHRDDPPRRPAAREAHPRPRRSRLTRPTGRGPARRPSRHAGADRSARGRRRPRRGRTAHPRSARAPRWRPRCSSPCGTCGRPSSPRRRRRRARSAPRAGSPRPRAGRDSPCRPSARGSPARCGPRAGGRARPAGCAPR